MLQTVLLVEDNPTDVHVIEMAMKKAGVKVKLRVLTDGAAAIDYIHSLGTPHPPCTPDLLILDLNLPWVTGDEILRELRARPESARVPVIVTSSAIGHPRYLDRMAAYGADRVFLKPIEMDRFLQIGPLIREMLENSAGGPRHLPPVRRKKSSAHTRKNGGYLRKSQGASSH